MIVGGEGCELVTEDGRRLIDGMAGLWTVNLGHDREDLVAAACEQMRTLPYAATFGGVSSPPPIELAGRLAELAPPGLSGVFFVSGGSEANETAIKLARRHWVRRGQPRKSIVLAHERSYHGLAGVTTTATRLSPTTPNSAPEPPTSSRFRRPTPTAARREFPASRRPVPSVAGRRSRPGSTSSAPSGWRR